jgi:hypothetical protein
VLAALIVAGWILCRVSRYYGRRVCKDLEKKVQETTPIPSPQSVSTIPENPVIEFETQQVLQEVRTNRLSGDQLTKFLVHELALARNNAKFTEFYYLLFGSQLDFLRALCRTGGTTTRAEAQAYFDKLAAERAKMKEMRFEDWIGFLAAQGAITASVNSFQLNGVGREFLVWVIRKQLPDRPNER